MNSKDLLSLDGPLAGPQLQQLAELVAQMTPLQRVWASGYLFGLSQQGGAPSAAVPAAQASGSLTILYGSQTGNAKGVAEALKALAQQKGLPVTLVSMADYKPKQLKKETHVLFISSTLGSYNFV